ncbi:MAG: hydantoinase B/oxoprolinase family protein, partial [Haloplanus sp.]
QSAPWGLFGGHSARRSHFLRNPGTVDEKTLASKSTTALEPGEVVSVQTPGGGGYGDPTERDPDAVLADVRDGKVSVENARVEYGVVIEDGQVDEAATSERRERLRDTDRADEPTGQNGGGADR